MENKINKKYYILIIFVICLFFGGLMGLFHNFFTEWDFINHRFYNGWAFLNNRLGIDLLPVYFRTTHNPYLDALTYLETEIINNPYILLFISGLKYGLFLFLSFLIYNLIFNKENKYRPFLIFSSIVLTAFSFFIILAKSFSHTDLQPACLLLISLYIYLKTVFFENTKKNSLLLFLASCLIGISITLKYYNVVFCFGLILSTIIFHKSVQNPFKTILIITSGSILGFLITSAPWFYLTYNHFHNPFYPYFEAFFNPQSNILSDTLIVDFEHLRPNNIIHFLFYPFYSTIKGNIGLEDGYVELKLLLGFSSVILFYLLKLKKNFESCLEEIVNPKLFSFIICFSAIAFYSNLLIFANFRYIPYVFAIWNLSIVVVYYILLSLFNIPKYKFRMYYLIIPIILLCYYIKAKYALSPRIFNFHFVISGIILFVGIIKFKKEKDNFGKYIYTGLTYIIILSVIMSYHLCGDIYLRPDINETIFIEDMDIEDGANVILGTYKTSVMVPFQNPKARFIGFAIPLDYEKQYDNGLFSSNEFFKNSSLENQLKEIIMEDKPLYFAYNKPNYCDWDDVKDLYINSLKYYSLNQITDLTNCEDVPNYVLFNSVFFKQLVLCKLK